MVMGGENSVLRTVCVRVCVSVLTVRVKEK